MDSWDAKDKKKRKKKKKESERRAKINAPPDAEERKKPKPGLFRNVSQVFSANKEILSIKSPRSESKGLNSPKSSRQQRFPETPTSVRMNLTDGVLFEGVLMVDDIFDNKGVLVDLVFRAEQIELTSPSQRLKLPSSTQRYFYSAIPSFRLYDKLRVWEFHWLEPCAGSRSVRHVYKFKDTRFKELNEMARQFVSETLETKSQRKEAPAVAAPAPVKPAEPAAVKQDSVSSILSAVTAAPLSIRPIPSNSDSRSDIRTPDRSSTPTDEESARRESKFTELYYDICDILLEETADGEFVTLADLGEMVPKDRLPWRTTSSVEQALWEFCSLYPETFALEEDETDRLVVGLLSIDDMTNRLEDYIMAATNRRARPSHVTHAVFSREALRNQTLDEFVQRSGVFKWHDGFIAMRKTAIIELLQDTLAQKQEELEDLRREVDYYRARKARKEERRRRRRGGAERSASQSPSPRGNEPPAP